MCNVLQLKETESSIHHIGNASLYDYLTRRDGEESKDAPELESTSSYTDEEFAILRHTMTEGGISYRKFGAVFAGFYYFFRRVLPTKDTFHHICRRTLKAKFMRLAHKDAMEVRAVVASLRDLADSHTISYMTDCSFYGEERMVSYFAYANPDMSGPTTCFTGIGAIAEKDAAFCAKEALNRLVAMLGPDGVSAMFGSCQDHAALNEMKHFFTEAEARGIPMDHAFKHCIKLGDDFHKLSLVDRAASFGAFGGARGVKVHSHLQLLYSRHSIHTKKASTLQAAKRNFMGRTVKKPPAPMETRWATIALASIDFLDELEMESENPRYEGCYATPHMWKHVVDTTKNLVHDMAEDITSLSMDPRIQIACQFEAELYTRFYKGCLNFNKKKSSLGYHHMFKSGDMPVEVERRRAWWKAAVKHPSRQFPATHARIQTMRTSGFVFGSMGGDTATSSAEMEDFYEKKIEAGARAGLKEFEKMYGVWEEVPTLLFHLRSKPHRQVVAKFVAEALVGAALAVRTPDIEMQAWFDDTILRGRSLEDLHADMRSRCHSLGLDDDTGRWSEVLDDLVILANDPTDDALENVGEGELHRFLYFNVDPVPVMNLIVELSFSCLKTTEQTNNSSETTDMSMATKMQIFHPARVERLAMKRDDGICYVTAQQLDTAKQLVHWTAHCAKTGAKYKPHAMIEVPPTEMFRRHKTSNVNSSGNKAFVASGNLTRQTRVQKGTTLDLAQAAVKIMGMDIADDVVQVRMLSSSPETLLVKDCLLVSGYWDRTFTTATEKNAAADHFPFKWLLFHRAVYPNDTWVKKQIRKWLAVTNRIMRYLGTAAPVRSDCGDPAVMKLYYCGLEDRMNFLESGVFIAASRRANAGESPLPFTWVLPPGDPPPFCGKAGFYKQLRAPKQKKNATPNKRKRKKNATTRKRKRKETGDSDSESDGGYGSDVNSGDDSDNEPEGVPLQRTVTLEGEWQVEFIVEGPRMDDGLYRVRWEGFDVSDDTWEPPDHLSDGLIAEYNEAQNSR